MKFFPCSSSLPRLIDCSVKCEYRSYPTNFYCFLLDITDILHNYRCHKDNKKCEKCRYLDRYRPACQSVSLKDVWGICNINTRQDMFHYPDWIPCDIYDVFSTEESEFGIKNIKIGRDRSPPGPGTSIIKILASFCL